MDLDVAQPANSLYEGPRALSYIWCLECACRRQSLRQSMPALQPATSCTDTAPGYCSLLCLLSLELGMAGVPCQCQSCTWLTCSQLLAVHYAGELDEISAMLRQVLLHRTSSQQSSSS